MLIKFVVKALDMKNSSDASMMGPVSHSHKQRIRAGVHVFIFGTSWLCLRMEGGRGGRGGRDRGREGEREGGRGGPKGGEGGGKDRIEGGREGERGNYTSVSHPHHDITHSLSLTQTQTPFSTGKQ